MYINLIVAYDSNYGIGKNNKIPWKNNTDMSYFKRKTSHVQNKRKTNMVIMGRKTFESLPNGLLKDRINVILSSTMKKEDHNNIIICRSIYTLLTLIKKNKDKLENIFVMGGSSIYDQFLNLELIDKIYLTKINGVYKCDRFFTPLKNKYKMISKLEKEDVTFFEYDYINSDENHYLKLVNNILLNGEDRTDRTGIGTKSIFGPQLRFDLTNNKLPLLTSKFVSFYNVCQELLWFLKGSTNTKELQETGVKIWNSNSSREFLDKRGLLYKEGDIGAGYGHQWRSFNGDYKSCNDKGLNGIDQISYIINEIKTNPTSRRIFMSAWNPSQLDLMALPPCHISYQFYVSNGEYLSLHMYQRSADVALGLPYNICSCAIFVNIIANICNLKVKELIISIGDAHIYNNHMDKIKEQIKKKTSTFPKLRILRKLDNVDDIKYEDFKLFNYNHLGRLSMKMAI
jgi:thymidylate synthase